ncbi:MAG TPA: long-chain fatty acid--CoA ligase [Gemmatimonadaceae bacterium]|nr:long-chain fatty acid--CoA ligase [Gemmatimonadaceae bacterium]
MSVSTRPAESSKISAPVAPGAPATAIMYATGGPRLPAGTLSQIFLESILPSTKPDAVQSKVAGSYRPISHPIVVERVRRMALGLESLGVKQGDRVAILSENRPEWLMADWACLTSGIADVPIYPTLPSEQAAYILRDSGAVAIFVSNEELAAKVAKERASIPSLRHVIGFGGSWPGVDMTLEALEERGRAADDDSARARYLERIRSVKPDDIATIIYTSGTTGEPKGAMLTHDNIYSNVAASREILPVSEGDVTLSFLPLSHIFQRMVDYLLQAVGVSIAYAQSMDTVLANFGEVRPTFVVSVPRVYEKIYARVLENALAGGAIKKRIFFWARAVGDRWATEQLAGREPGGWLSLQYGIAQRLVFSKLKARVGGRLRYFVSGGAPLAPEINKFFYSAGLVILEGYGLTETSPVIAVNTPAHLRIGTVGRAIRGVEVAIAPDGEILTRGPHVMKGYFNKPDATRDAIDADGWFHTGDIGVLEDDYLRITDRKKDIIVTAGGKNIAPQPIENKIKTNKYVSQAVMIGDKRKFVIVLVVPNFDQLEKWAKVKNLLWTDHKQLLALPLVRAKMDKEVLSKLEGLGSFEMPKKVVLLEQDFTVEGGELTPTLKVKRRVIDQRYKSLIDTAYAEGEAA